jgi:hypothetical protein
MKLLRLLAVLAAFASFSAMIGYAQSLGDVAREQKSRKATSPVSKRPPVTNDDLAPVSPDGANGFAAKEPAAPAHPTGTASSRNDAAAEFKAKVIAQKQRVNILELQMKELPTKMDRWKTSDCTQVYHPGDPYGNRLRRAAQTHGRLCSSQRPAAQRTRTFRGSAG